MKKSILMPCKKYQCFKCESTFVARRNNLRVMNIASARALLAERSGLMADKYELLALYLSNNFLLCYICSEEFRQVTSLNNVLNYLIEAISPCKDLSWRRPIYDSIPASAGFSLEPIPY